MVNTMNNNVSSSSADETKKQRKKQAKREAKVMLAVEQAKQDVQRAEQKVAKFQARLEARIAHLRTLEAKLARIRTSSQGPETDTSGADLDGHQEQSEPTQGTTSADAAGSEPYTVTEEDEATTEAPVPASPVNTTPSTDQEATSATATDEPISISSMNPLSTDQEADSADAESSQAYTMNEGDEASTDAPIPASPVNTAPPTDQEVSLPPAEGRADILPDQETAPTDSEASQQEVLPSESQDDASSSGSTTTETAQPADETGEEILDREENFQWWARSENKTTPAYDTTSSSADSQEQKTQESLGSSTKQLEHTQEEGEWQPEEDASQETSNGD